MLDLLVKPHRLQRVGDARLVVAIARRQPDALAEVYRRHAGAVLGLARRVLGELRLNSGTQFDPSVVRAFCDVVQSSDRPPAAAVLADD